MFDEEPTLTGHVLETARASMLSRELELQLQVGNCIEALLLLQNGVRDASVIEVINETAGRLRGGAEDLSGEPRTVAQSASAVGVLQAANLALLGESGKDIRDVLLTMASALESAAASTMSPVDIEGCLTPLVGLHTVLAGLTGSQPDEVHGLSHLL